MNKLCRRVALVLIVLATLSCNNRRTDEDITSDPAAQGARIVQLIQADSFEEVASLLHYPATYTQQERLADQSAVANNLRFLSSEFGHLEEAVAAKEAVEFYKLSISGGDVPYWQSLPNVGQDGYLTYRAVFSKFGPGIFHITFIRAEGGWQPRSIEFGLERGQPKAGERMANIARQMVARMARRKPKAL